MHSHNKEIESELVIEKFKYKTYLTNLVNVTGDTMERIVEIGTVSSRGQIAIPAEVRRRLGLNDGEKVMFITEGNTVIIKKVDIEKTWEEVTRPLREAAKNSNFKEEDVVDLVHRVRKKRHENRN